MRACVCLVLGLAVLGCDRWHQPAGTRPNCALGMPVAQQDVSTLAGGIHAAATPDGFVFDAVSLRDEVVFDTLVLPAGDGWTHALVRTDPLLRVVEYLELVTDPLPRAIATGPDGSVIHHAATASDASTITRYPPIGWAPIWMQATRPFANAPEGTRTFAANAVVVANAVPSATIANGFDIELLDAATGARHWSVPGATDLRDVNVDPAGNVFAATTSAIFRFARGDGTTTQVLALPEPSDLRRVSIEFVPGGFVVLEATFWMTLFGYDEAWTQRWRLPLAFPLGFPDDRLWTFSNGDVLLLEPNAALSSVGGLPVDPRSEAVALRVAADGTPRVARGTCYRRVLAVDLSDHLLAIDEPFDEMHEMTLVDF